LKVLLYSAKMAITLGPEELRHPVRLAAVLHVQTEECPNQAEKVTVLKLLVTVTCYCYCN